MQSITALAHLRSAVLYFMDISEQCGYTVEAQCKLFHSIKPLFNNKPVILVINKIDVLRLDELAAETRVFVDEIINLPEVTCVQTSAYTEEGVVNVRDKACDALLAHRVEQKLRGNRLEAVANKIHVAMPSKRDDVERPAFIPAAAMAKKKYDKEDPERIRLEKDDEQEMMGKGIFTQDLRSESIRKISHTAFLAFDTDARCSFVQRDGSWRIPTGSTTSSPSYWTERTLPTLSTRISWRSSRLWSEKRRSSRPRDSTRATTRRL